MPKNLSDKYYQEYKDCKKKLVKNIQNIFKEEKEKKRQYGDESSRNLSEDEKGKLVEYRKKYYRMRKNALHFSLSKSQ